LSGPSDKKSLPACRGAEIFVHRESVAALRRHKEIPLSVAVLLTHVATVGCSVVLASLKSIETVRRETVNVRITEHCGT